MTNIVIIGSGPAGVSAALYTARAGVDTTVLTRGPGALDRAEEIQNYYGFAALAALMVSLALMGADIGVVLLLVAAYLFVAGCMVYYLCKYQKEM